MSKLLQTRDLVLALRWAIREGAYLQRSTGKPGWQVLTEKNEQVVLARADTRRQAWEILANMDKVFYLYGP